MEFIGDDFSGLNFTGRNLDLRNASFLSSSITGSNFEGTNLSDGNFRDAIGSWADFGSTNLSNTHFESSTLEGTQFSRANATDAHFEDAILKSASFYEARVMGANFEGADLTGASFNYADVAGANFTGANLTNTDFRNTVNLDRAIGLNLAGAILTEADITDEVLEEQDRVYRNLEHWASLRTDYNPAEHDLAPPFHEVASPIQGYPMEEGDDANYQAYYQDHDGDVDNNSVDFEDRNPNPDYQAYYQDNDGDDGTVDFEPVEGDYLDDYDDLGDGDGEAHPQIIEGVAFQVHNYNAKFLPIRDEYVAAIRAKVGDVPDINFTELENILALAGQLTDEESRQELRAVVALMRSRERELTPPEREVINCSIAYMLTLPPEARAYYTNTFINDCYRAYEGAAGMTMSCAAGVFERIHLIINDTLVLLNSGSPDDCDATCKTIMNLFSREFTVSGAASQWRRNIQSRPNISGAIKAKFLDYDEMRTDAFGFTEPELETLYEDYKAYATNEYLIINQTDTMNPEILRSIEAYKDMLKNLLRDSLMGGRLKQNRSKTKNKTTKKKVAKNNKPTKHKKTKKSTKPKKSKKSNKVAKAKKSKKAKK